MATNKKSKPSSAISTRKPTRAAAPSKAVKSQPKKPAAKPTRPPVKPAKKNAAASATKKPAKPAAPVSHTKKAGATPLVAAAKDLSKKIVKTAIAPKPLSKPVPKAAAKPVSEPKKPRFSKSDLDQFKIDLLAMRARITGQSGSMRNDALQRTDEINPEEDGTDAFMRLQTLEQVSSQQQIIVNIDEALRAIDKGSYGVCDNCGELINKPRLAVLPFAKNCIKCQSEMERAHRPGGRR